MNTEHDSKSIEDLISEADTPRERLVLMVINRHSQLLKANTDATQASAVLMGKIATRLDEHISDYQAKMNRGRGAWAAVLILAGIIQALITLSIYNMREDHQTVQKALAAHGLSDANLRVELLTLSNHSNQADTRLEGAIEILKERCSRCEQKVK